jgi:hypothetical protein
MKPACNNSDTNDGLMTRFAISEVIPPKTARQYLEKWIVDIVFEAAMDSKAKGAEKGPLHVKLK